MQRIKKLVKSVNIENAQKWILEQQADDQYVPFVEYEYDALGHIDEYHPHYAVNDKVFIDENMEIFGLYVIGALLMLFLCCLVFVGSFGFGFIGHKLMDND